MDFGTFAFEMATPTPFWKQEGLYTLKQTGNYFILNNNRDVIKFITLRYGSNVDDKHQNY